MTTPYQTLNKTPPTFAHLKTFGWQCFPELRPYQPNKLTPISISCIFLGYAPMQKGYYCLDLLTRKVYTSRHVVFNEDIFPYQTISTTSSPHTNQTRQPHPPLTLVPISALQPATIMHSDQPSTAPSAHTTPNHITTTSAKAIPQPQEPSRLLSSQPPSPISLHSMQTRHKSGISKSKVIFDLRHTIPSIEPTFLQLPPRNPNGEKPCPMNTRLFNNKGHGHLSHLTHLKMFLAANGHTNSNTILMDPSLGIRHTLWPKDSSKNTV